MLAKGLLNARQISRLKVIEALQRRPGSSRTEVAEHTGLSRPTVAAVVNVLNPELIVFGGDLAGAGDTLLNAVRAAIDECSVAPAGRAVRVAAGTLGERAEVLGAAALLLAQSPHTLALRVSEA